jgi:REP-associated tyrosine transposase
MADFRRKPNRLPSASYRGERAYFLTLCTAQRRKILTDSRLVNALLCLLREKCSSHFFNPYAFCSMPDHLHLVVTGKNDLADLASLVKAFKGASTSVARKMRLNNLWQKGYYDHVLRGGESLDRAAWYIFSNPVRAGLVERAEEWPYSGSFEFEWKNGAGPPSPFIPPWKDLAR